MNQVWTRLTFDQRGDVAIEHWRVPTFLYYARFKSGIFSNLSAFQGFSRSQQWNVFFPDISDSRVRSRLVI